MNSEWRSTTWEGTEPGSSEPWGHISGKSCGERQRTRFQRARKLTSQPELTSNGASLVLLLKGTSLSDQGLPAFVHSCSAHTLHLCQQYAWNAGPFPAVNTVKSPFFSLPPKPPTVRATWGRKFSTCTKPYVSALFAQLYNESPNELSAFGSI